ncbi:Putative component of 'biosynthetic module' [Peptoclostridium litorale DSM 5388]|uniref:Putative component of 'biosynthetic module' domain-containing protein n=1 Tax=Peptoclostridium litorale DSM 5388 TaxID=1121324 RepID=A0A069RIB7_PEPLI|nr:YceG family protein [Peptoclostridium litorale]KDR93997.1 hypothetical protein CLIT_23c02690 [Peptoclostridium litorale DSM 5388]SIN79301.1 Putative component of 'biosynthetic module' [Peptoclostridium litorale DSM 5388]
MNKYGDIFTTRLKISNDILRDFAEPRKIDMSSQRHDVDIFFYRYIGMDSSKDTYIDQIRSVFISLLEKNIPFLHYIGELSSSLDTSSVSSVKDSFSNCSGLRDIKCVCESLEKNGSFYSTSNDILNISAIASFRKVISLFMANNKNTNMTILKNLCAKLLSWINTTLPKLDEILKSAGDSDKITLPKIIYMGDIKNHEIYFLIFLSMLGCDVLFVNSMGDCEFSMVDKYETYSKLSLNAKTSVEVDYSGIIPSIPKEYFNYTESQNIINASLKSSTDIFLDISYPLQKRSGFIAGESPIVPVFFYRVIGISENSDKYYNSIYTLHKKLSSLKGLYLKFEDQIPIPSDKSSAVIGLGLKNLFEDFDFRNSILWINFLKKQGITNISQNYTINSSFEKNLKLVLDLYIKNTPDINFTKLKNFCLKMLIWAKKYMDALFSGFDFASTDENAYNPKILYYGDIKLHEIYFLILMSKSGCDVLYINTSSDGEFSAIDKNQAYSKTVTLPKKEAIEPFPKTERISRHETVAYKSSREISNIIYSDEDGFYRPWQFENHNASPVTLKTTYDELKILWNEQARLRSSFKADSTTVFIPNIFSKISGVHDDIGEYAQEIEMFKSAENVFFTSDVPFSNSGFSTGTPSGYSKSGTVKRDNTYPYRFFLGSSGKIEKKALVSSSLYKFSHLKTSLQYAIISKIQYLMDSDILTMDHHEDMKLKILSVILNIDKALLNMIQKFDYPFDIPKFIAYDSSENIFSLEDCIIISFLYLFGFDILIITPTGYNNMEKYINSKYFDVHKLEHVKFDLDIQNVYSYSNLARKKGKSLWSSIFGNSGR